MKINFINSWSSHAKKETKSNIEIRIGLLTILKLSYNSVNMYVPSKDETPATWLSEAKKINLFYEYEIMLFNFGLIITIKK